MKETNSDELKNFLETLMEDSPEEYVPWLFPVKEGGKAPDVPYGTSWKDKKNMLSMISAMKRLERNDGNVGIAGRPKDRLILLDIDHPCIESEIKDTLKIRSRSRTGTHAIYWSHPEDEKLPCNIPTDTGEIRSSDQYVVAPGSYVPCTEEELTEKLEEGELTETDKQKVLEDPERGFYTVDNDKEIATIQFKELPDVFKEHYNSSEEENWEKEHYNPEEIETEGNRSALFDLEITDLTGRGFGERDPHPLHESSTGANWSIKGVGHCWRHLVSLNALQFLCVEAGYLSCLEAGSPHHNSSAGASEVINDDEAIWEAWKHAKKQGYIPEDDPIPVRAICHIARNHGLCDEEDIPDRGSDQMLPKNAYTKALEVVERDY
jgi:putative DNA primase/helicase